ncbi:MAG TPA: hypothetical protein VHY35_22320 [Stellaceae bacterium]|nr:hypothetical protein [Stellaceae bacterium]
MRYQPVSHDALPTVYRPQPDKGNCGIAVIGTAHFVHPETGQHRERPQATADGLLSLATAPTFAIMALLTGVHDSGMPGTLCSAVRDASPFAGMVPMYLLMSAFHSAAWLRLLSNWRQGADPA